MNTSTISPDAKTTKVNEAAPVVVYFPAQLSSNHHRYDRERHYLTPAVIGHVAYSNIPKAVSALTHGTHVVKVEVYGTAAGKLRELGLNPEQQEKYNINNEIRERLQRGMITDILLGKTLFNTAVTTIGDDQ